MASFSSPIVLASTQLSIFANSCCLVMQILVSGQVPRHDSVGGRRAGLPEQYHVRIEQFSQGCRGP